MYQTFPMIVSNHCKWALSCYCASCKFIPGWTTACDISTMCLHRQWLFHIPPQTVVVTVSCSNHDTLFSLGRQR